MDGQEIRKILPRRLNLIEKSLPKVLAYLMGLTFDEGVWYAPVAPPLSLPFLRPFLRTSLTSSPFPFLSFHTCFTSSSSPPVYLFYFLLLPLSFLLCVLDFLPFPLFLLRISHLFYLYLPLPLLLNISHISISFSFYVINFFFFSMFLFFLFSYFFYTFSLLFLLHFFFFLPSFLPSFLPIVH